MAARCKPPRRRTRLAVPAGHGLDGGSGRRQVPVPDQRRRGHELCGARRGKGHLLHEQHARDAPEDGSERHLLVARPRDECRRQISAWTQPRSFRKLWNLSRRSRPRLGRLAELPGQPGRAQLVGRRRRRPLPGFRGERPHPGLARPQILQSGRPEGTAQHRRQLGRDHLGAGAGVVLLERHAGRRRRQPRRGHARRVVQLALALDDDAPARGPERRARGLRPAVFLGWCRAPPATRSRSTRRSICSWLEGLLQRRKHRDLALTGDPPQGQRLLLACPGARPGWQRRRLELRAVVHEDLRQGRAGRARHRHEHQEPAHARQPHRW